MRPVVVFGDGDVARASLESFARESIPTILLYTRSDDYARYSRFADKWVRLHPPLEREYEAIDTILNETQLPNGALLFPCTDAALALTSRYRDALARRFVPFAPPWEILSRLLDKGELYRLAAGNGVHCPRVHQPRSLRDLEKWPAESDFPVMVKPCLSHLFFPVFGQKLIICENPDALRGALSVALEKGLEVLVSEVIPGPDSSLFQYRCYVDSCGSVRSEAFLQKLRQYPAGFGVGCYARSTETVPEIREATLAILNSLDFKGLVTAEFKHDSRDGLYKLIEINTRTVLQETLFTRAGANFPLLAYRDLVEGSFSPVLGSGRQVYWQHNFLELARLLYLRDLQPGAYLAGLARRNVGCVSFFTDPGAYLAKVRQYWIEYRRARGARAGTGRTLPVASSEKA